MRRAPVVNHSRAVLLLCLCATAAACANATGSGGAAPPIVQPGAPGQPNRSIDADEAVALSRGRLNDADVRFMQQMIGHHAQAMEMTHLIAPRTMREAIRLLGRRIELSQADEIDLMRKWLVARGQPLPDAHVHELMPGMLTAEEMDRLARAQGDEFDRLFLEGMIKHHGGALIMVKALFDSPGAGEDADIFAFASDVDVDQRIEIARMGAMLEELQK
jgi:uncharacterized protein (DUF305 family)